MELLKLCLLIVLVGSISAKGSESISRLLSHVMNNYDKIVPPAAKGVNVSHGIDLQRIVSLADQVLTLDTYAWMSWNDGRLVWEPTDYDFIDSVRVPASMLWIPDIVLYNDASDHIPISEINAMVTNAGNVTYIPKVKFRSYCDYKAKSIRRHGRVRCELKLGSWTYDADRLDLFNPNGNLDLSDFIMNQNWKLVDSSAVREVTKYDCCPQKYSTLKYSLTLKAM